MKTGDTIYYEFEKVTIKRMEDGDIKAVSGGNFETCGRLTDSCFPYSPQTKIISDRFYSYYHVVYEHADGMNLNFPDIHRKYVEMWRDALITQDPNMIFYEAEIFTKEIIKKIDEIRKIKIFNVRIFGR